ncbi:MAG: hypothetical protein ACTHJW_24160 [Streptosporangiaceae bacterium]
MNGMRRGQAGPADVDLDRAWTGVAAQIWRRHPGLPERLLSKLLRSPGLARALLATPSLVVPWLIASAVVFAAGAVVSIGTREPWVALLAPAIAGAGVAYAYGPGIDPAYELSMSMAVSDRMVLLARVLAIFVVDSALGLAASAFSATAAGLAFGWLIPMTAVSGLALVVAVVTKSANVGVAAAAGVWAMVVLGGQAIVGQPAAVVSNRWLYLPYLAIAVCCAAVVLTKTSQPRGSA